MMLKQRFCFLVFCLAVFFAASVNAQEEKKISPDLSVAGVKLGSRATAREFLKNFQPTFGEDSRPAYYFYNKFANQVMKLTGASVEDRFFIVEIEVYRVGKSYRAGHFQAEKISHFKTEKDIFIGYKQSKASAWTGIPNVDGKDMVGSKTVVKKIGEPTERTKDGEKEVLIYRVPEIEIADENGKTASFGYSAQYEFNDGRLKRYVLKISPMK